MLLAFKAKTFGRAAAHTFNQQHTYYPTTSIRLLLNSLALLFRGFRLSVRVRAKRRSLPGCGPIQTRMKKVILLFVGSFLVTSVFSASLKVFFQTVSWREVLTKGLVIPCFTWTMQLLLSAAFLDGKSRLRYWNRLGWVCLVGSIALLPVNVISSCQSCSRK